MTSSIVGKLKEKLISGKRDCVWLHDSKFNGYFRITHRYIFSAQGNNKINSIDVASIESKYPGKGNFTELLNDIEDLAKEFGVSVFIESILRKRFKNFFLKRGYTELSSDPSCVYKQFNNEKIRTNL